MTGDRPRDDEPRIEELGLEPAGLREEASPARHSADVRLDGVPVVVVRSSVLVAVLVAVAIVKPWASPSPPAADATAGAAVATAGVDAAATGLDRALSAPGTALSGTSRSDPTSSPLPAGTVACGTPVGWRLVTVGRLADRPVEGWSVVDPLAAATGPTDPRIPVLPAGEAPLAAAGACRPTATPGVADDRTIRPPVLVVAAWRLVGRVADPLTLIERGPAAPTSAVAQLYVPAAAHGAGWGPGRYVLEVSVADLAVPAWLGFEVTPSPPSASGASPDSPAP